MTMHRLEVDEFYDASYLLFAVHCRLEDYRLAYLLNKHLGIRLTRKRQDIDYKYFAASYAIYEWEDSKLDATWNLVSNICKKEESTLQSSGSLFNDDNTIIKTYNLLPELKTVDYLIKLSDEYRNFNEKIIINSIQSIPQVITTYSVDLTKIKSKEHLIFN